MHSVLLLFALLAGLPPLAVAQDAASLGPVSQNPVSQGPASQPVTTPPATSLSLKVSPSKASGPTPGGSTPSSTCKAPSPDCAEVGKWNISLALGYGERSNPVKGKSDIPLVLIPQISYYGKRFFLENLELGFTLHETERHTFNLIATPGYDRVFFYRHDLQNIFASGSINFAGAPSYNAADEYQSRPLRRRHSTYLIGPEWGFTVGRFVGQVDALYEISGRHNGYEVRAAMATPIIQADQSLVASFGLTWKSSQLVRYYYGIEELYEPGSAVNPFVKLGYSLPVSARWTFMAFAHYEYLGSAIGDSPIITSRSVTTVFAGMAFKIL